MLRSSLAFWLLLVAILSLPSLAIDAVVVRASSTDQSEKPSDEDEGEGEEAEGEADEDEGADTPHLTVVGA